MKAAFIFCVQIHMCGNNRKVMIFKGNKSDKEIVCFNMIEVLFV